MATPEVPEDVLRRLSEVEDAVQRFKFTHLVKTEATTNGLGVLHASLERLQHEVSGFRAETAAELETLKSEQSRQGEVLAEILRRLPEPGTP